MAATEASILFATILRMLTRRSFGRLVAATLALESSGITERLQQDTGGAALQFSVMMWTLDKQGSFEENLRAHREGRVPPCQSW